MYTIPKIKQTRLEEVPPMAALSEINKRGQDGAGQPHRKGELCLAYDVGKPWGELPVFFAILVATERGPPNGCCNQRPAMLQATTGTGELL